MRVAVTGATGFLGGRLVRQLAERGDRIIAFGRDEARGAALEKLGAVFLPLDLEEARLPAQLPEADVFVHAAALSSAWGPAARFQSANVSGTRRALDLARAMGAGRFIFISSPSVTFRLEDRFGIRETDPLPPPINAYAASKAAAEVLVREAGDLRPVILRPRAIYGKGDVALLPRLIRAASQGPLPLLRGGRAVTQLTHVEDVVGSILAAIQAPPSFPGGTYHVAGPEELPVRLIAETACRRAGYEPRWRAIPWPVAHAGVRLMEALAHFRPGAPEPRITLFGLGLFAFSQVLDRSALLRDLDFSPQIRFNAGLEEAFSEGEG